jgi:pyridoxal phosphate enzyme (YggS family)
VRGGRDPSTVTLVAVTKTVAAERVAAAVHSGITDLGENRVQEALAKRDLVPPARWHLIGHLQTNKAKSAATAFAMVHSIDSERVAAALAEHRPEDGEPLPVLVEVELTGIASHTGVSAADVEALLRALATLPHLRSVGLMTMAPHVADPEQARPTFARLRSLRDDLEQRLGIALPELSMGMSDDYEVAVEEGATIVRVGRAIFGERPLPG